MFGLAPLSAHEVVVEQMVEMTLAPRGDRLVVSLHVPVAVAGDPALPGLLRGSDEAAIQDRLRVVASGIAHALDVRQDNLALPDPAITVRRAADRGSLDLELQYALPRGAAGVSARLNTFSAKDGPVRTRARFQPAAGAEQIVSVAGPAARVAFDPSLADALPAFAVRGLRALFDAGDQLLFLTCLVLPMRRGRSLVRLFAAAAIAQGAVLGLYAASPAVMIAWLPAATLVGASAIAIAALQNIANARMRWVRSLTVVFGALNGWALGDAANSSAQFAGSHQAIALLTFGAVVLLGELWLGALAWAVRSWLDDRGLPERITCLLGSAIVAHTAVHRVVERSQLLTPDGWFGGEHALVWLTVGWVVAILVVAASNAISGLPAQARAS